MLEFYKYNGLGNDFILLNNIDKELKISIPDIIKMCHRRFGIGADGVIFVEKSEIADIKMNIYNSDGSNPAMCGNGIRCFSKYVFDLGIVPKENITVETGAGVLNIEMTIKDHEVSTVKVNMGKPYFENSKIPCTIDKKQIVNEKIEVGTKDYNITSMLMGVPHTVIFTEDVSDDKIVSEGPSIECSPFFPKCTNVNFVKVLNKKEIELRTWERGAGYTYACGTGSCAGVIAGVLNNLLEDEAIVHLRGGDLKISWDNKQDVYMEGPAEQVFRGYYYI